MLLGSLLLAASVLNENLYLFTWYALVPFLYALEGKSLKKAYALGVLFGFSFFLITSFWIIEFLHQASDLPPGRRLLIGTVYWFYCAHLFAFLAVSINGLAQLRPGSQWLSLSLLGTLLFAAVPMVFPADLSISQSNFLIALQAIDITGAQGLHFVILLHNGLLFALLKNRYKILDGGKIFAMGFIGLWFIYGVISYGYWSAQQKNWPLFKVGLVQPNLPPSIHIPPPEPGYSRAYPMEIEVSHRLAQKGADLIVWPEARYRGYFDMAHVKDAFKHYAVEMGAGLLIQDLHQKGADTFNTSALLSSAGVQEYQKYLRIPFGEYLPLANLPWIGDEINTLFANFYTPIAVGAPSKPMLYKGRTIQPLICFEVIHPVYVAQLMQAAERRNQLIQVLVAQSNDSWFGTSRQPHLHLAHSQLRSVELRLPLVHGLNNGPSAAFSATGQMIAQLPAFTRASSVMDIAYPQQPIPTLFARFPFGFIGCVTAITVAWLLVALFTGHCSATVGSRQQK